MDVGGSQRSRDVPLEPCDTRVGEDVLLDDLARFTVFRNGPYDEPSRVFGWRTAVDPDSVAVLPLGFCEASDLTVQGLLFHVDGEPQPRALPLSDVVDLIRRAPLHVSGG